MEFSWNYQDSMGRLARDGGYRAIAGNTVVSYCPVFLTFDINPDGVSEVPTFCESISEPDIMRITEPTTMVVPLPVGTNVKSSSGAETILKYFSRNPVYDGRIAKAITPKGETYYGATGIILDKDFMPLMLSTTQVSKDGNELQRGQITIHMSPKVFTDDISIVNKSLAKKGMAYYLSYDLSRYAWVNGEDQRRAKVVIDDMSDFFRKVTKPDVNASPSVYKDLLKENLDEVLKQFYNDLSNNNH